MKAPAFQFYAADYLADAEVQMMTLEEEGIYIRLLCYCWREGSIPNDDQKLSLLVKGGSTTALRVVKQRFKQHAGDASKLVHERLENEREKHKKWSDKSKQGGIKSAESRRSVNPRVVEGWLNTSSSSSSSPSGIEPPVVPQGGRVEEVPKSADRIAQDFEEDWPKFWVKIGKDNALRKYREARKKVSREALMAAVVKNGPNILAFAAQQNITPIHPATWLHQGRWKDEETNALVPARASPKKADLREQGIQRFRELMAKDLEEIYGQGPVHGR